MAHDGRVLLLNQTTGTCVRESSANKPDDRSQRGTKNCASLVIKSMLSIVYSVAHRVDDHVDADFISG